MKLYVAYLQAENLGGRILGVTAAAEHAQFLCHVDHSHRAGEDHSVPLTWSKFVDREVIGWQAIPNDIAYYVEETELEIQSRVADVHGMDWKDRRILQLTIDNGRLAQDFLQQAGMLKPLENRVAQLGRYIDGLLAGQGSKSCTFTDDDGKQELWETKL
jgi:hypothetical protein